MVKVLKVKKAEAEQVKKLVQSKGWLAKYHIGRTQRYVLIPLTEDADLAQLSAYGKIEERNLQPFSRRRSFTDYLDFLKPEERAHLRRAYDVVGDIAILEIPPQLAKHELAIAWAFKRANPQIKVVAVKAGPTAGQFRIRPLRILVGEQRLTTIHKESGVLMKVDLGDVYFNPRYGSERLRIANLVKPNEKILVMFAGVGPFALVIAKKCPKCQITAIELNPEAYRLMEENIRLNRFSNIKPILGDVSDIVPKLKEQFDRIIMVLPEKGWDYLDLALKKVAKKGVIHFYAIVHENEIKDALNRISNLVGQKLDKINFKKVRSYAPHINIYAFDIYLK